MRTPFGRPRRRPTRALMTGLLAGAFFMAAIWPGPVSAGEEATTRRPGDLIVYRFACHDAETMIALAERGGAGDLAAALVLQGKCFQSSSCIAARLEEWIAGPFALKFESQEASSVWRLRDQLGNTVFALFYDAGGPHQPAALPPSAPPPGAAI